MLKKTVSNQRLESGKKALLIGVLASNILLLSGGLAGVHAQEISLSTYPSTIQLRAYPPATVRSSFAIQNKSSNAVKLNVMLKSFKPDPVNEGKVLYLEGNDPAFFKKVQVIDNGSAVNTIELGPKQTKNLELRITATENEQPQDYYFSIIFLTTLSESTAETETEATARSYVQGGIAMNVLYAVGPKEQAQGYLEEFSTTPFRSSGPVPFTVKVKNNGTHYVTPKGVILIKNIFGQTVGRIDLQNTSIVAGTSRLMLGTPYNKNAKSTPPENSSQTPNNTNSTDGNTYSSIWPEKFLLGFYKADLSLALSEEGPVYTQTIRFLALPTEFMLALFVAIVLILLITIRVRQKLRES